MSAPTRTKVNTHRLPTIWIRPEEGQGLERIATDEGRTISDLVREAIRQFIQGKS